MSSGNRKSMESNKRRSSWRRSSSSQSRVSEYSSGWKADKSETIIESDAAGDTFVNLDDEDIVLRGSRPSLRSTSRTTGVASRKGGPWRDQEPAEARVCVSSVRGVRRDAGRIDEVHLTGTGATAGGGDVGRISEVDLTGTSATAIRRHAVSPRSASRSLRRSSMCQYSVNMFRRDFRRVNVSVVERDRRGELIGPVWTCKSALSSSLRMRRNIRRKLSRWRGGSHMNECKSESSNNLRIREISRSSLRDGDDSPVWVGGRDEWYDWAIPIVDTRRLFQEVDGDQRDHRNCTRKKEAWMTMTFLGWGLFPDRIGHRFLRIVKNIFQVTDSQALVVLYSLRHATSLSQKHMQIKKKGGREWRGIKKEGRRVEGKKEKRREEG